MGASRLGSLRSPDGPIEMDRLPGADVEQSDGTGVSKKSTKSTKRRTFPAGWAVMAQPPAVMDDGCLGTLSDLYIVAASIGAGIPEHRSGLEEQRVPTAI